MNCRAVSALALVIATVAGCEKAASQQQKGSGPLGANERTLFQFLPRGAQIYFAGDYSKLQDFMKSGLGQFTTSLADKVSPSMSTLTTCLAGPRGMKSAMSMSFADKKFEDKIVIDGLKIEDVARCGKQSGLETTVDADGKFVAVVLPMPTGAIDFAYYQLASGALYSHQTITLGSDKPVPQAVSRAVCEAELAAVGHASAADDPAFTALAAKADRSKTGWFVASGAGTAFGSTLGELYGSVDATSGVALDVTVQLVKATDADKVEQAVAQLRKMADQMPASFKAVVTALRFERSGERLHASLALSDSQLKSVSEQLGGMLGAQIH